MITNGGSRRLPGLSFGRLTLAHAFDRRVVKVVWHF